MCIAIYKPAGQRLFEDTLKNSWDNNPDGAGFMYVEDGKLHTVKGLMKYEDFIAAYMPHQDKQAVIHFRIATHGGVSAENTHPFQISDTLGLVHNGIISNVACDIDKTRSDTWHFVEKYMKPYQQHWKDPAFKSLVEKFIVGSKFIIMDAQGNYDIYNESMGSWQSGCWMSNTSWQARTHTVPTRGRRTFGSAWDEKDPNTPTVGDKYHLVYDEKTVTGETLTKGSIVEIEAFGPGIYVWVVSREPNSTFEGKRAKVSVYCLKEKVTESPKTCVIPSAITQEEREAGGFKLNGEVIFKKNYNHFRVGDTGKVVSLGRDCIMVQDLLNKPEKHYLIPKSHVSPAAVLLLH